MRVQDNFAKVIIFKEFNGEDEVYVAVILDKYITCSDKDLNQLIKKLKYNILIEFKNDLEPSPERFISMFNDENAEHLPQIEPLDIKIIEDIDHTRKYFN